MAVGRVWFREQVARKALPPATGQGSMNRGAMALAGVAAAMLLSGASALLYQLGWQRILVLFTGSDSVSSAIIASLFLAGLGIGSLLGGEATRRLQPRGALLGFLACEAVVALWGWNSADILHAIVEQAWTLLPHGLASSLAVATVTLLPPTIVMGMGFPLLVRAVIAQADAAPRQVTLLYGLNTLGGGLAAATGWLLMVPLGLPGMVGLAAGANVLAALIVWAAWAAMGPRPAAAAAPRAGRGGEPAGVWFWCWVFGVSGLIAVSLEVAWFRIVGVSSQYTSYVFGITLGVFLLADAAGMLAGAALVRRVRDPLRAFLTLQLLAVALALAIVIALGHLYTVPKYLYLFNVESHGLNSGHLRRLVTVAIALVAPPAFLIGASYPLVQKAVQDDDSRIGRRTAWIQTANIAGNSIGGLLTGLVLLHLLGTTRTLILLALLTVALAVVALRVGRVAMVRRDPRSWLVAALAVSVVLLAIVMPDGRKFWLRVHSSHFSPDSFDGEDRTGVAILKLENGQGPFYIQGFAQSGVPFSAGHAALGALGPLVHPDPKRALVVGVGAGGTPYAASVRPGLERIDAVEIVAPVADVLQGFANRYPDSAVARLLADPRVALITADARPVVAAARGFYDVIEADAILPHTSGSTNLYSVEYFRLVRRALAPGGIAVQWAPTPAVIAGFLQVFPHVVLVQPSSILLGSDSAVPFDHLKIQHTLRSDPQVREHFLAAGVQPVDIEAMSAGPPQIWGPDSPRPETRPNTDLRPFDEYALPAF